LPLPKKQIEGRSRGVQLATPRQEFFRYDFIVAGEANLAYTAGHLHGSHDVDIDNCKVGTEP
jgi:hypothetical protein